jgi:hypothetical protein
MMTEREIIAILNPQPESRVLEAAHVLRDLFARGPVKHPTPSLRLPHIPASPRPMSRPVVEALLWWTTIRDPAELLQAIPQRE